jgi:hypothetical protein
VRRLAATAAAALAALAAATPVAAATPALRSPDGSAACALVGAQLTCSNRTSQLREPPLALALGPKGGPGVVRRKLAWDGRTPVLRAGAKRLGAFTCRAVDKGLLCSNAGGGGIAVAADRISALLPPAVSP